MNYYIEGDAANADKIRAAFEKLGIRVPNFRSCGDSSLIYFSLDREVFAVTSKALELFQNNPDYKELELPVVHKFKVGDEIKTGNTIETIAEVGYSTRSYYCESGRTISFANQDLWHLVPKKHYAIANFHAGMPVLVRDANDKEWRYVLYSHHTGRYGLMRFFNAGATIWNQCIPFNNDTKHLLGTTDMPSEEYINW